MRLGKMERLDIFMRRDINVPEDVKDLKEEVLREANNTLRMNLSLREMLKGNTPIEYIAKFRENWVEPYETVIKQLEEMNGGEFLSKHHA